MLKFSWKIKTIRYRGKLYPSIQFLMDGKVTSESIFTCGWSEFTFWSLADQIDIENEQ